MAGTGQVFYCNYCEVDVTDLRIKCADCHDFDLCVQCFACGAEIGPHKKNHRYQVIYFDSKPMFRSRPNWSNTEELELLNKVMRYRFGNWDVISEFMTTKKSSNEIRDHFNEVYVNGNIGKATWETATLPAITDHTEHFTDHESLLPSTSHPPIPEEICKELEYLPLRDDFRQEYDNEAEAEFNKLLGIVDDKNKLLAIDDDNDELYIALKMACIDICRRRVQKRFRIKQFVKDYDLVRKFGSNDVKSQPQTEVEKEESALHEKLKILSRLHSAAEHEALVKSAIKEQELKTNVKELKKKIVEHESPRKGISKSPTAKNDHAKGKQGKARDSRGRKGSSTQKAGQSSESKKESRKSDDSGDVDVTSSPRETRKRSYGQISKPSSSSSQPINYLNLMSRAEKKLCSNLDLEASCYMALKTVLLKERNIMIDWSSKTSPKFPEITSKKVQTVTNFMVNSGWINAS